MEITYLQTELKTGNLVERAKTVDLLVKTKKKLIHVEMNANNPTYLHLRNACYFFNKISLQIMFDLDKDDLKTLSNGDDFVAKYTDELTKLNDNDEFQSGMTYEEDQQMILNTEKDVIQ